MDKDTKVLLMAVVIILVALVSFNLSDLTGKFTRTASASIIVTPSVVSFDKYEGNQLVNVRVNLGSKVVGQKVFLYREPSVRQGESLILCRKSQCSAGDLETSYSYAVNQDMKGNTYYFVARDRYNRVVAESNRFRIA